MHIVSASFDRMVRIWDANTGVCVRVLEGHSDGVNSAKYDFVNAKSNKVYPHIFDKVNQLKAKGNSLLKLKKYHQAILTFHEGLSQFKDNMNVKARSIRSKILLRISICYFILEIYEVSLF